MIQDSCFCVTQPCSPSAVLFCSACPRSKVQRFVLQSCVSSSFLHKSRDVNAPKQELRRQIITAWPACLTISSSAAGKKIMLFSRTQAVRNVHEHLAVTSLWFKGKTLEKPEKFHKRGRSDIWPTPLFGTTS
jgi:hypothetical protein